MRHVLSFLKPHIKWMALAWLLMLVELFVELWHPLLMQKIIDEGVIQNDWRVITIWGGVMLAASILAFAAGIANSFAAAHVGQQYGFELRRRLFRKIESFSLHRFDSFSTGSLITRLTGDVTQMQNMVFMSLRIMMRAPLLIVFSMVMAFLVHVKLALILVVIVPALLCFLIWMMTKAASMFSSVQSMLDRVNSLTRENIAGIRLIKAWMRGEHEQQRFARANEELTARTMRVLRFTEAVVPVLLFGMNLVFIFILFVGKGEIETGGAKPGEVVAIINYATRIAASLSVFTFITMAVSRAKASARRIEEVLTSERDIADEEGADEHAIQSGTVQFENVSFRYPGSDSFVLRHISFSVRSHETVAILGETGAGKTSLLQLIPRLYEATKGVIKIDGIDVRAMKQERLRASIGFVPQDVLLFSGTIRDNICFGAPTLSEEQMMQAARDAQIHDTVIRFPDGYDTVVGQKGVALSGGQKQRLSIARALVRNPKILLLDDCTSALDAQTEANLWKALKTYRCTTLVVTQKITTAMEADSIILLREGRLLAKGTHKELLETSELYQKLVASQLGKEGVSDVKAAT